MPVLIRDFSILASTILLTACMAHQPATPTDNPMPDDTRGAAFSAVPISVFYPSSCGPYKGDNPMILAGIARDQRLLTSLKSKLEAAFGSVEMVSGPLGGGGKIYQFELAPDRSGNSFYPFPGCRDGRKGASAKARITARVRVLDGIGNELISTTVGGEGHGSQLGICSEDGGAVDDAYERAVRETATALVTDVLSRLSEAQSTLALSGR